MEKIYPNLYIGTDLECRFTIPSDWAIVHTCKNPCHVKALGYKGSLPPTHPNYLVLDNGQHLFLNMVDMEKELNPIFTNPIMKSAMIFIKRHIKTTKILIHCNQGLSRSPSIALLYLAQIGQIRNDSFQNATIDFMKLYPMYKPGNGILMYMARNWNEIVK